MQQDLFEDVLMPTQIRASHRAGLVQVRDEAFGILGAQSAKSSAPCPAQAPTIRAGRRLRFRQVVPPAAIAVGFGEVRAHAERVRINERAIAVIAVICGQLVEAMRGIGAVELTGRLDDSIDNDAGTTHIATLHALRDDGSTLYTEGALGLVGQARAPSFILVIFRVGIVGKPLALGFDEQIEARRIEPAFRACVEGMATRCRHTGC